MDTSCKYSRPVLACPKSLLAVAFVVFLSPYSNAANDILDTQGFESYSVGPLQGQAAGLKNWTTVGSGGGTAAVENSIGVGGSKGVRVDRGASSDDWWAVSYSGDGLPTYRYVLVEWDMRVNDSGAGGNIQGPFIGVETYDDTIIPQVSGALGVDATTRDVLYEAPGSGVLTETGVTVDANWHHFQIRLDFLSDLYATSVDYVSVTAQPLAFVDGASNTFTDADIAAFATGPDNGSQRQNATAYVDNFLVRQATPGDYNFDGTVDAADYVVWRLNIGGLQSSLAADGDGDGHVDGNDYVLWRANFGQSAGSGSVAATDAAIPEPTTWTLLMFAVGGICARSRRTGGYVSISSIVTRA